ncbi:putative nucleic acid-binding, replication factor A [Helianthus annuus]|nr:putative nucleic acid-binding, replication factor A [Helianthus annuus]
MISFDFLNFYSCRGIKLNCTLWDEYYDEMFDYIQSHKQEVHVVLLVQFGSFNKYKGKTTLSNAFHITRLFINADIEEIRSFKTKFVEKICKTSSNGQKSIGSSGSISVADDFLVKHPFSNFRDVTLFEEPCEVIVVGTVLGIDDKDDWYYLGCEECNRKVETTLVIDEAEDGAEEPKFKQVLVCSNPECPKEVVGATPVFRIPIRVQDFAAIASLTLFDREARKMFGKTAIQLLEKSKASSEEKIMPYQFKILNDKKYAFKIQVSHFNIDNHTDGYAVHKLVLLNLWRAEFQLIRVWTSRMLMFHLAIYQLKILLL